MKFFDKEKKLIILDVDGVILDIKDHFEFIFCGAARFHNLPVGPFLKHWDGVKSGTEKAWPDLSSAMKAFWGIEDKTFIKSFSDKLSEKEKENPYRPIWGSREAITLFRRHGLVMALCTSRPSRAVGPVLELVGLNTNCFVAVSTKDYGYAKPDPRVFNAIFAKVGHIPKESALYVGDFETDFEAARAAGLDFAAVLSGVVTRQSFLRVGVPPRCIFDNLFEVVKHMYHSDPLIPTA